MGDQPLIKIAVDAMGGEHAPDEVIRGALAVAQRSSVRIVLVGEEGSVCRSIRTVVGSDSMPPFFEVRHAPHHIGMDEAPLAAIRQKRDASICVAARMLASGEADALVTAGHTGAATAASLMNVRRIPGIDRPALALVLPTLKGGRVVMLDIGANVDSKAINLFQFAQMGSLYSNVLLGVEKPRVGLMSIGEEDIKGNELTKAAFRLLQDSNLEFIGNVEGSDVVSGDVDVVATDGFVGNVLIKGAEGCATFFVRTLKDALNDGFLARIGAFLLRNNLRRWKNRIDWAEYGGALLLGVNGVVVITHGNSDAKGISNSIRLALQSAEGRIVDRIRQMLHMDAATALPVGAAKEVS